PGSAEIPPRARDASQGRLSVTFTSGNVNWSEAALRMDGVSAGGTSVTATPLRPADSPACEVEPRSKMRFQVQLGNERWESIPDVRPLFHLDDIGHVELDELAVERFRGRGHVGDDQLAEVRDHPAILAVAVEGQSGAAFDLD